MTTGRNKKATIPSARGAVSASTRVNRDTVEREKIAARNKVWILVTFLSFSLVFTYLSLNLKTIDMGYQMKSLMDREEKLQEEIDKLKSDKARLLNLERVEKEVTEKLGYQYPEPDQFIKVFED